MSIFNILHFITQHPLNKNAKFSAIKRFINWQISSRLAPGKIIYPWIENTQLIVGKGETGITGNIYCGLHELEDMAFVLHSLDQGDLFIDIGANVGSYSILACGVAGANGFAFEPVPNTYQKLVGNIRINNLSDKIQCFNMGLGNQKDRIKFSSHLDTMNHALSEDEIDDNAIEVNIDSLDVMLQNESPHILKIDVEGYETLVLEGAQQTLKKESLAAIIIELNGSGSHYGFDEAKIHQQLLETGYSPYTYEPFKRQLIPLQNKNQTSGNTLYIKNKAWIENKIQSSPYYMIHHNRI